MKFYSVIALLLVSIVTGFSQEALVNPTSVTLSQQGAVTVIVTDNKGSSSGGSYATVGTLTATYTNAVSGYAANQGFNYITASSATTGNLNAGTYPVTTTNSPQQVTVILWNESTNQGFEISQVELAYNSASSTDQSNFQSFIVSLVQEQLAVLQSQITALQDSDANQNTSLSALSSQLSSLTSSYNALQSQLAATSTTDGSSANDEDTQDNTIAYVGVGLGTAGIIGAIMNAIFDSKSDGTHENQ